MKVYTLITGIAFLLNLIWENLQAPLYGYSYGKFLQHFGMCFWATLGDVIFIIVLYFIVARLRNDRSWFKKIKAQDLAIIIPLGFIAPIIWEKLALSLSLWHYTSAMPIIPWLNVGLAPILQMLILPLFAFYITGVLLRHPKFKL